MEEIAFELGLAKKEEPIETEDEKIDIPEPREKAHPCPRCQGSGLIQSPVVGYLGNYLCLGRRCRFDVALAKSSQGIMGDAINELGGNEDYPRVPSWEMNDIVNPQI